MTAVQIILTNWACHDTFTVNIRRQFSWWHDVPVFPPLTWTVIASELWGKGVSVTQTQSPSTIITRPSSSSLRAKWNYGGAKYHLEISTNFFFEKFGFQLKGYIQICNTNIHISHVWDLSHIWDQLSLLIFWGKVRIFGFTKPAHSLLPGQKCFKPNPAKP